MTNIKKNKFILIYSLIDKASANQKSTVIRPQSIFSDSSFSLPTGYYDKTTPYLPNDAFEQEDDDDVVKHGHFNEDDLDDIELDQYNLEQNDNEGYDMDDFVEAYNPNVRIPRPKLQFNPMKIFNKVGI